MTQLVTYFKHFSSNFVWFCTEMYIIINVSSAWLGGYMRESYLNMIQKVIDRMGNNSFLLKGWAILVFVGIFTFTGGGFEVRCILFTNVPLVVLWFLDSYYLQLERKYRKLYDYVRLDNSEIVDFNMNPNQINITLEESKKMCFFTCLFSKTEAFFYITCIVTTVLIYIFA